MNHKSKFLKVKIFFSCFLSFVLVFNQVLVPIVFAAEGENEFSTPTAIFESSQNNEEINNQNLINSDSNLAGQSNIQTDNQTESTSEQADNQVLLPAQNNFEDTNNNNSNNSSDSASALTPVLQSTLSEQNSFPTASNGEDNAVIQENNQFLAQTDIIDATPSSVSIINKTEEGNTATSPSVLEEKTEDSSEDEEFAVKDLPLDLTATPSSQAVEQHQPAIVFFLNQNQANIENKVATIANTGDNFAGGNGGETKITTGDAFALANLINLINANLISSNLQILVINVDEDTVEINLNEIWKKLKNSPQEISFLTNNSFPGIKIVSLAQNQVKLTNKVDVIANTGENRASGESNQVHTGNAISTANVANFVNLNLYQTRFFFGIINITTDFTGNLILPAPEEFTITPAGSDILTYLFSNLNKAFVKNEVVSFANTGKNQVIGDNNQVTTGNAESVANVFSTINTNALKSNEFQLILNLLGEWKGSIKGWNAPDSQEKSPEKVQIYSASNNNVFDEEVCESSASTPESLVISQSYNSTEVENQITVSSNTGENKTYGIGRDNLLFTGWAKSLVNLFNFVNLNLSFSNWFNSLVNVFGNWSGNLVAARPDLEISITSDKNKVVPGEEINYILYFSNQGYESAQDIDISMIFPEKVKYLADTSNLPVSCFANFCQWHLNRLDRGEGGQFTVFTQVDEDYFEQKEISFFEKFAPKVFASEIISSFIIQAKIENNIPELNSENNIAEKVTGVEKPNNLANSSNNTQLTVEENQNNQQPILEITAKNNVNKFVYPGDTVTFEVIIENKSNVPAYNAVFTQKLYNSVPGDLGQITIPLGTITPWKKGKLTFGLHLKEGNLEAGNYYTLAVVQAQAPNGEKVISNQTRTDFKIKLKELTSLFRFPVLASEENYNQVLGIQNECPEEKEKILPYILLFALSSLLIVEKSRKFSKLIIKNKNK